MKHIDHIGIAVKDLEASNKLFASLLNASCYKIEDVPDQQVATSFFKTADQKIELVAATSPSSPITKFIDKKGEGIHHIAFEVDDIHAEIVRLKGEGFEAFYQRALMRLMPAEYYFSDTPICPDKTKLENGSRG